MSVVRRATVVVVAVVVVALVVAAGLSAWLVRRPLPDHAGTVTVAALDSAVRVLRDDRGIPHIYADNDLDLMRGQGYVDAQDRFFEMDYRRHITAGRLSELVGENEAALDADRMVRTMGWRAVAEAELDIISDEARDLYEAYAEGVNAYLGTREASELALEYTVLGLTTDLRAIEPWSAIDSLAWLKAMSWDLSGNFAAEVGRAAALRPLAGDVGRVEELYPDQTDTGPVPVVAPQPAEGDDGAAEGEQTADGADGADSADAGGAADEAAARDPESAALTEGDLLAAIGGPAAARALGSAADAVASVPAVLGEGEGIGSNAFVVAGEHTASGEPVLANDPHLRLGAPSLFQQVGLHCTERSDACTFDVTGVGFAGMPGVIIGHNDELAWGLTTLAADVTDLTLQRLYDDGTYLRDGERVPLEQRRETIEVNGGEPVVITVAETEHGPIVSDVLEATAVAGTVPVPEGAPPAGFSGYAVSLQWTALEPGRTGEALFALNRATSAEDIAAAAALLEVPSQNIVFATTDGDIGYQAPGRIPVRASVPDAPVPSDGSWPRPGWDSRYDWQGYVDPADLPAVLNPAEGFIVTANQAVMPAGEGPFLTGDWGPGYRSDRIRGLLERSISAGTEIDVELANEIMLDDASPFGQVVVPALLQVAVDDDFVDVAVDELRSWSAEGFPASTDSSGAAYFAAVWNKLLELTFGDDLPASEAPDGGGRWLRVITPLLDDPASPWWDDRRTVNVVEGRDEILRRALVEARHELTNALGKEPADWTWGQLHRFAPRHPVLGSDEVPWLVRRVVNPAPVAVPGAGSIVNATHYDASARDELGRGDYTVIAGPALRMVADLADLDASTWVVPGGTSGHPAADAYTDQIGAWAEGETYPWHFTADAVAEEVEAELVLEPRS